MAVARGEGGQGCDNVLGPCMALGVPGVPSGAGGGGRDALEGGEAPPPPPGRPVYAQPLSPRRQMPASVAFVTDSNRPQPIECAACGDGGGGCLVQNWGKAGGIERRRRRNPGLTTRDTGDWEAHGA